MLEKRVLMHDEGQDGHGHGHGHRERYEGEDQWRGQFFLSFLVLFLYECSWDVEGVFLKVCTVLMCVYGLM